MAKLTDEIAKLKAGVDYGEFHPKKVKEQLASEIVDRFHGNGAGGVARDEFEKIFSQKNIPTDIKEFTVAVDSWICQVLVDTGLEKSSSQARRDIKAGAVKLDQVKVEDDKLNLSSGEYVLQKGKKNFVKIIVK